jgi:prepilin-type N-terminal cleavage/methylation domain-containing protein
MRSNGERGFTIMEMMVVMIIIAILGALSYPNMKGLFNKNKLRGSTSSVTTSLYLARTKAINEGMEYGVKFLEDGTFQIQKDPLVSPEDIGTPYSLDSGISFGLVSFVNRTAVFNENGGLNKACLPSGIFTGIIKITNGTIDSTSVEVTFLTGRIRETNK